MKMTADEVKEAFRKQDLSDRGIATRYHGLSLSTITPTKDQLPAYNALVDYLASSSTSSLILAGTVGTGKTMMAQALAQDLMLADRCFGFTNARRVIRKIRSTWSKGSEMTEEEMIAMYVDVDYLFIDEIGMQYGTAAEQIAMFDIINGRYENEKPTILITNLDIQGLKETIGDRIIDRLRQDGGQMLAFNWDSLRVKGNL